MNASQQGLYKTPLYSVYYKALRGGKLPEKVEELLKAAGITVTYELGFHMVWGEGIYPHCSWDPAEEEEEEEQETTQKNVQ